MNILIWVLMGLFALKIVWNLGVPYALLQKRRALNGSTSAGISLMPGVEVLLLLAVASAAWISSGNSWFNRPIPILSFGVAMMFASYIHMILAGMICGWFASTKEGSGSGDQDSSKN